MASGQGVDWQLLSLTGFPGLNTSASDMARKNNEAIVSVNLDYSRYGVGSFGKRFGYDSVSFLAGQDECIGLSAVYLSDFRQYLGSVWDSAGVGYGGIYVSPFGEAQFTGTVEIDLTFNVHDNYEYQLFIITGGLTDTASYTSDGSATFGEIVTNLEIAIDTISAMQPFIFSTYNPFTDRLQVREKVEFAGTAITADSATTVETRGDSTGRIWSPYSVQNSPSFGQFNDEWFIVNGAQKGVRYNGTVARSWPPNAPGEPSIIPLADTGGLDGEYRYTFRAGGSISADSLGSHGYVSAPVRVKSGQIMLTDFSWFAADTTDPTPDTMMIFGYRTRANPGRADEGDYAFFFDTVLLATSSTNLADSVYIDSIADNDLSSTDSVQLVQITEVGRDSTGAIDVRYGAPGFLDIPTWGNPGVFAGIPIQRDTLGVVYRITHIDTINGDESGGGALSYVMVDTDSTGTTFQKPSSIRLALPNLPGTGLVYNLYRAHVLQVTWDSLFFRLDSLKKEIARSPILQAVEDDVIRLGTKKWENSLAVDTVILSEFRLVAQISADSSAYTDSVSYDSLQTQPAYRGAIPPLLSGVFAYDNFLWGWDGSFLVWSDLDSVGNWGAFNRQGVDPDDGDAITVCFPTRTGVAVLKNYSRWNFYDQYTKIEKVGDWGCIAPRSYAAADNGHFYLSARGVILETEGLQLERTVVGGLVSTKLRNFDIMSIATKSAAVGRYDKTAGQYRLTIGDSVYVYDKIASDLLGEEVWSIWLGATFTDATLYNTEDQLDFLPGDDFYFIQDGSSNLFKYGDSETDPNSTQIAIEWENANILIDPGWKSELMAVGIRGFSDSVGDILWVRPIDETGAATVANVAIDSMTQYYRARALSMNRALEHGIEIRSLPPTFEFLNGRVERIDIWYVPRVEPVMIR
jgi:hypothetical protein